jgi:hypothetical protein
VIIAGELSKDADENCLQSLWKEGGFSYFEALVREAHRQQGVFLRGVPEANPDLPDRKTGSSESCLNSLLCL